MIHQTFTGDYLDLSQVQAISSISLELSNSTKVVTVTFDVCFYNSSYNFVCSKPYKTPAKIATFEGVEEFKNEQEEKLKPTIEAWKKFREKVVLTLNVNDPVHYCSHCECDKGQCKCKCSKD